MYKYGYFPLENQRDAKFKTINYKGKKAVYAQSISEYTDEDGAKNKCDDEYWYDAETGIIIENQQKLYINGKLCESSDNKHTVKPNQKFDKSVFEYDPAHKTINNLK